MIKRSGLLPGHNEARDPNVGTLCISRKNGETVKIGDDIVLTIQFDPTQTGRDVRLVITAPKTCRIMRSEVKDDGRAIR